MRIDLRSRIFDMTSHYQDGSCDVMSLAADAAATAIANWPRHKLAVYAADHFCWQFLIHSTFVLDMHLATDLPLGTFVHKLILLKIRIIELETSFAVNL